MDVHISLSTNYYIQNQFHKGKIEKKAMHKLNYILLVVFAVIYTGCTHKKVQKINSDSALYEKICATEVPKENLDIPMIATATYDNGTPFYGKGRQYYELSENDLAEIKSILNNQIPKEQSLKAIHLNIDNYFRQYLAYTNQDGIFVLVNLYKYYYISHPASQTKGIYAPAKGIHIISLIQERNRARYDNILILLDLAQKRIKKVDII